MTGLDTNVLARFIMADDKVQSVKACNLIQSFSPQEPGFIAVVCLIELVWVLRSKYKQPKADVARWLDRFLSAPEFLFENHEAVSMALKTYQSTNADFADCLIERLCHLAGCKSTVTFDVNASKTAGMRLL